MCSETYSQAVYWPEKLLARACWGVAKNTLVDEFEIIERKARRVARRAFGYNLPRLLISSSWNVRSFFATSAIFAFVASSMRELSCSESSDSMRFWRLAITLSSICLLLMGLPLRGFWSEPVPRPSRSDMALMGPIAPRLPDANANVI